MPKVKVTPNLIIITLLLLVSQGCSLLKSPSASSAITKKLRDISTFEEHFAGMAFYDPQADEWLYRKNADKYFTPASNTKLLTYFAALKTLGDRLDALQYYRSNDTLYFRGTADPTLLHPDFSTHLVADFLSADPAKVLVYLPDPVPVKFGSGWAWDDYQYDFQPELSDLPVWGNVLRLERQDTSTSVIPVFFEPFIEETEGKYATREAGYNLFRLGAEFEEEEASIPFISSPELTATLLANALQRKVLRNDSLQINDFQTLQGLRSSTLYRIMMLRSDNFYAEQMNLMGSFKLGFGWNTDAYRNHIIRQYLGDLPQPVRWRDGSGLSRYNLITPESMVKLLEKIEEEAGFEQIKNTFPVGGKTGTIRKWYPGQPPYVYAKTGTLSNNHNLSGFLITNSGKRIVFSLMNNNYVRPNSEIKEAMQQLLEFIRDQY